MFATNPETQIEIEKLSTILRNLGPDGLATYADLSTAAGYAVQRKPFPLIRARKLVEDETGIRFETVARAGVKRLSADALPGIGISARARVARLARRQAARLTGLKYNDITAPIQARLDAERSLLGAISAVSKAQAEKIAANTTTGPIIAAKIFEQIAAG